MNFKSNIMFRLCILIFFMLNIIESRMFIRQDSKIDSIIIESRTLILADSNLYNSKGYIESNENIYNTQPADSIPQDVPLPSLDSESKMQQDQLGYIKKEYRGNPASSDITRYRQEQNIKEISKDSKLKIAPSTEAQSEVMSETPQYEFIINYAFKIVDEVPYGEQYKISTPLNALNLANAQKYTLSKTCELNVKEKSFEVLLYPHYTQTQTRASLKKQMQFLLYNFLQNYKGEVLECLILDEARLDSMDTTINLESRTKSLTYVKSYMLVDFSGGILKLEVFKHKNYK